MVNLFQVESARHNLFKRGYPLVIKLMLIWVVFFVVSLGIGLVAIIFGKVDHPIGKWITGGATLGLAAISTYGFVKQLLQRKWVRDRYVAHGNGIVYLWDGVKSEVLKKLLSALSTLDVYGEVKKELCKALPNAKYRTPGLIICVAKRKGELFHRGKGVDSHSEKRKVLGLQSGNWTWVTWAQDVRQTASLVAHEVGHVALTYSRFSKDHHRVFGMVAIDSLLNRWTELFKDQNP